ncbi:hypothetical protein ES703_125521 [subsurface metagenome]
MLSDVPDIVLLVFDPFLRKLSPPGYADDDNPRWQLLAQGSGLAGPVAQDGCQIRAIQQQKLIAQSESKEPIGTVNQPLKPRGRDEEKPVNLRQYLTFY